jgi:hypothetical protein
MAGNVVRKDRLYQAGLLLAVASTALMGVTTNFTAWAISRCNYSAMNAVPWCQPREPPPVAASPSSQPVGQARACLWNKC